MSVPRRSDPVSRARLRISAIAIAIAAVAVVSTPVRADSVVVWNEIHYHPRVAEPSLEWIELHNPMAVDVDMSHWFLGDGVFYEFPDGTVLSGGAYLIVALDPQALAVESGHSTPHGPFAGRLDNSGERLTLFDRNGREISTVRYRSGGDWPVEPDGSGVSLAKLDPNASSEEARNWVPSREFGGTPGRANFPSSDDPAPPRPEGLVSYWSLDETSGAANDPSGGNDGTLGSGALRSPGLIGSGAVRFDNSADAFINVGSGDGDNFAVTEGIALEAVIAPEWSGASGDADDIFRKEDGSRRVLLALQHDGDASNRDVAITPAEQPVLSFGINVGGVYSELDLPLDGIANRPSLASLKDGRPHHVAAIYSSATGRKSIWIDGALVFSATLGAGKKVASGGVATAYIGNMSGRREPFTGVLDEVAFWRRPLTDIEIAAHASAVREGRDYFSTDGGPSLGGAIPLAFNETRIDAAERWIEIVSTGTATLQLAGVAIESQGGVDGEFVFTGGTLEPGGFLVLDEGDLGFSLAAGNRIFILGPDGAESDRRVAVAGVRLDEGLEARERRGAGRWLVPDRPTPGAENSFALRDDIVIHEIYYHGPSLPPTPARTEETAILALDAEWRYDASGVGHADLGWTRSDFDDNAWPRGRALFYREDTALPATKRTELPIGFVSYYFRTTFEFTGDPTGVELGLRPIIDDGAVYYLNGVEIFRHNMDPGPVGPDTLASVGVGDAIFDGPFVVAAPLLRRGTNWLAVELHQRTTNSSDVVMGLEIRAVVTIEEAQPFRDSPESWIELHNRGAASVDLGGFRLRDGIEYEFLPGTMIAAGGYAVVAGDIEHLRSLYPELAIAGEFSGRLAKRGELITLVDPLGNPADEVQYFDEGRWPSYADGGGSSLELRNPNADNSMPEAWGASDETAKTAWRTYSYRQVATANIGPTQWQEFVLGLLDAGEVLIDDLRVTESPSTSARELISNGTFESGSNGWRILGNHRHSRVIDDPDDPGNRVLHVIASGATEHMHNHLETTVTVPIVNGREYEIRFRARWLAGSHQVHTRLYFNRVPRTTLLDLPTHRGTPGRANSLAEPNLGPTFDEFSHAPVVPAAGEAVTVAAVAADPDGVTSATLWYAVHGGAWVELAMQSGAGGSYRATIPGQSSGRVVQFYVEARDTLGAVSTFPRDGRVARALYKVEDGQARLATLHNVRIILTPADEQLIYAATNVMSNEKIGTTVIYDEKDVFYDVGVRLKGSERGRPESNRVSFDIEFDPSRLFRGVHDSISLDRSGGWSGRGGRQDEIVLKHLANRVGGIPGMYDDIAWVIAPRSAHTGTALLMSAQFDDIYLDSAFENGSDGTKFKLELIYYPLTTDGSGLKLPQPDSVIGADNADHGDDKEIYRWNWLIRNHRDRDDYAPLVRWCKSMSASTATLGAATEATMDVDQFLRAFALYGLGGVNDTYTFGNNHNNVYFVRPSDGKMLVFPWDMDFCWTLGTSSSLIGDQNLGRVIRLPQNLRRFWAHVRDILDQGYDPAYVSRWTTHYGALAGQNWSGVLSYIGARRTHALSQIPAGVPFAITTNGGSDLAVSTPTVTLEGDGGIDVQSIIVAERDRAPRVEWTAMNRWRVEVSLVSGANSLTLLGLDLNGELTSTDRIVVTTTFAFPAPSLTSISPEEALPGATVTVRGAPFFEEPEVIFGGTSVDAVLDSADPGAITVVVPAIAPGRIDVRARSAGSALSNPLPFTVLASTPRFIRGDANLDGAADLSDAIAVLLHLFGGRTLSCLDAGDLDDDETISLTDAIFLLEFLFRGGPAPTAPFPVPGDDPGAGAGLDCAVGLAL
jgi:hypothetical protein